MHADALQNTDKSMQNRENIEQLGGTVSMHLEKAEEGLVTRLQAWDIH